MELKELLGINQLLKVFANDVEDTFNYKFKIINNSDFELRLTFKAKSRVLIVTFNQVANKLTGLNKQYSALKSSNPDLIESYTVPEQLNSKVHASILKQVKDVGAVVEKDGFKIVRSQVDKCEFRRVQDTIEIHILVGGQYVR